MILKLLENPLVNLDINGLFLSFNYTDTLERYYKISRENIEYIHNKAGEGKILSWATALIQVNLKKAMKNRLKI
ncbi:MAG: hypothetical protein IPJ13_00915 [Saprospiraceae bacterium]|nr:hypothetical protein [Saprospiraceae bacterium]